MEPPVYVRGENTHLWMLQNFKQHCSLRFTPKFFATQKDAVEDEGPPTSSTVATTSLPRRRATGLHRVAACRDGADSTDCVPVAR